MDNSKHPTKKRSLWLLPDHHNQQIRPGLYIVSTPIGNLRDITLRALDVLSEADIVLCEDTRVTGKLLNAYGLNKKLMIYNDHNAPRQRTKILEELKSGKIVAQVSDAGTPAISDPGYRLLDMAIENNIYVTALPGANAPLPALLLSGLPTDSFSFIGFLPVKSAARRKVLKFWESVSTTLITFETGKRLGKTLKDIENILGERQIAVVREISKLYEESRRGSASEIHAYYEEHGWPKGEITLVIAPGKEAEIDIEVFRGEMLETLKAQSKKDVTELYTLKTGLPKKVVYEFILNLTKS